MQYLTNGGSVDISITAATYRHGGQDMILDSLKRQTFTGTYEYILSDEIKHKRQENLSSLFTEINFKHIQPPIYDYISVASTFNSAIKESSGELIAILGDYSWIEPEYLNLAWKTYKQFGGSTTTTGCRIDHEWDTSAPFDKDKFISSKIPFPEDRHNFITQWIDNYRGFLPDGRNLGLITIPRHLLLSLNGFDEEYNGAKGRSDHDLARRAELIGHRFLLDTRMRVHRVYHPHNRLDDVFTEKSNHRPSESNIALYQSKINRIEHGLISIDGHVGIEDRRWKNKTISFIGGGSRLCTDNIISILRQRNIRCNSLEEPGFLSSASTIIWYGVSPGDIKLSQRINLKNIKTIFWWTGTDVYNLINHKYGINPEEVRESASLHLCVSERLRDELRSVGIDSTILLDVPDDGDAYPLPKHFSVLIYWQGGHPMFMREDIINVIRGMPDVTFHIIGGSVDEMPDFGDNCIVHGWVGGYLQKQLIFMDCSVLLRLNLHDGIPYNMVEMFRAGRNVITTYPYPHCIVVNSVKEAINEIRALERVTESPKESVAHYSRYTVDSFVENFCRIVMGKV